MKKTLIMLLVLMLVCTSICAVAELVDLSQFDDAQLVQLLQEVQQEMADRKIEKTATLQSGKYLVGKDLPAGRYVAVMKNESDWWGSIFVYVYEDGTTDGEYKEYKFHRNVRSGDEGAFNIVLEEGDLLECTDPMTLTIFAGVQFQ
jgi:hypothetical protein